MNPKMCAHGVALRICLYIYHLHLSRMHNPSTHPCIHTCSTTPQTLSFSCACPASEYRITLPPLPVLAPGTGADYPPPPLVTGMPVPLPTHPFKKPTSSTPTWRTPPRSTGSLKMLAGDNGNPHSIDAAEPSQWS